VTFWATCTTGVSGSGVARDFRPVTIEVVPAP
jgi:hypothetical protein